MTPKERRKVGLRCRKAREAAGLTQSQVAERMGYASADYRHVLARERGQTVLSLDWLHRFAAAVGCSPRSLDFRLRSEVPDPREAKGG